MRAVLIVVPTVGVLCLAPVAMALTPPHIYWANELTYAIGEANLDATAVNQSFIAGSTLPQGVAVDGSHIYWTNAGSYTIGEANLDGTGVNESFITGANLPEGVAVDGSHIYWTNRGSGAIGEANLDGTAVNESFITGANRPEGVAADGSHIYWANELTDAIGEANLDGTAVNQSFITGVWGPAGIAVSVPEARISLAFPPAFATTPQGTLSGPQTLTVSNQGQRNLLITGLSFAGADPGDFVVRSDTCRGSIAPAESCQLTVSFAPQAQGSRTATLQIASNDFANSPLQVALAGTASPPQAPPNTILNGSGPPASSLGNDGDFYIDTIADVLYGPKAGGVWPSTGVSLVGPQGLPGQNGTNGTNGNNGTNGTNGNTMLNGIGAPSDARGTDGDFYIDTEAHVLYGPKANGHWPATGTSLVGPTGPRGPAGMPVCRNTRATILVCDTLFVPGTWTVGPIVHAAATLTRAHTVYARGSATVTRNGHITLRLHRLRRVTRGRYTVTVRFMAHRKHLTIRRTVAIR